MVSCPLEEPFGDEEGNVNQSLGVNANLFFSFWSNLLDTPNDITLN